MSPRQSVRSACCTPSPERRLHWPGIITGSSRKVDNLCAGVRCVRARDSGGFAAHATATMTSGLLGFVIYEKTRRDGVCWQGEGPFAPLYA